MGPRFGLRLPTDGEEGPPQLFLSHHVEDVGLILRGIDATAEVPPASVVAPGSCVVARSDEVEVEPVGALEESLELDVLVAPDARVRCPAGPVLGVEIREDGPFELRVHIGDLEVEADQLGHGGGVFLRLRPAAPVLHSVQPDQLHVRAEHAVSLLVQQGSGDGRIHASTHGDQH